MWVIIQETEVIGIVFPEEGDVIGGGYVLAGHVRCPGGHGL